MAGWKSSAASSAASTRIAGGSNRLIAFLRLATGIGSPAKTPHLRQRMHAGVGTPGTGHLDGMAFD